MTTLTTYELPLGLQRRQPLGQQIGSPTHSFKAYKAEVEMRWYGDPLWDALENWKLFEEHRADLKHIIRVYLRDNWVEGFCDDCYNPEGTLTAWLWQCSDRHWWLWDFCNHYQRCHLRRGAIAYSKQLINEIEANTDVNYETKEK